MPVDACFSHRYQGYGMCDVQAFELTVCLSLEGARQREGFEGLLLLSSTMKGGYRGARTFTHLLQHELF